MFRVIEGWQFVTICRCLLFALFLTCCFHNCWDRVSPWRKLIGVIRRSILLSDYVAWMAMVKWVFCEVSIVSLSRFYLCVSSNIGQFPWNALKSNFRSGKFDMKTGLYRMLKEGHGDFFVPKWFPQAQHQSTWLNFDRLLCSSPRSTHLSSSLTLNTPKSIYLWLQLTEVRPRTYFMFCWPK